VRRRRDERGSALVELSWLGLLLLVPMLWIVVSVFEVQQGAFGVSSAARSAGRAYALAPNDAVGRSRAEAAVRLALDDQGLEDEPFTLRVTCEPFPADCHSGTSVITVRVFTQVKVPMLPEVLGGEAPAFALDSTHTVPIGQYQEVDRAAP
jgi:Flp pilus assembly protein TadG